MPLYANLDPYPLQSRVSLPASHQTKRRPSSMEGGLPDRGVLHLNAMSKLLAVHHDTPGPFRCYAEPGSHLRSTEGLG
jgi:hypothetical protein